MKKVVFIITVFSAVLFGQSVFNSTKWEPFEWLIGNWEGTGGGKFGSSTVEREYDYFMGGTYLLAKNKSVYEKQERNPEGEIHNNWDIFSYDKNRNKYVLRSFHAEDITNTFTLDSSNAAKGNFVFITESIENFGTDWKAKVEFKITNEYEFVEIFSLASPNKEFTEYIRNTFKRVK